MLNKGQSPPETLTSTLWFSLHIRSFQQDTVYFIIFISDKCERLADKAGKLLGDFQTGMFILNHKIKNEIIQSGCKLNDFIFLNHAIITTQSYHKTDSTVQSHF